MGCVHLCNQVIRFFSCSFPKMFLFFFLKCFSFHLNIAGCDYITLKMIWNNLFCFHLFTSQKSSVLTGMCRILYPLYGFLSRLNKYLSHINILTTWYANVKQMLSSSSLFLAAVNNFVFCNTLHHVGKQERFGVQAHKSSVLTYLHSHCSHDMIFLNNVVEVYDGGSQWVNTV